MSAAAAGHLDEAGKKKPHLRKEVPREELIAQILARRAAPKIPEGERYRPNWLMALEMIDELAGQSCIRRG